MTGTRYASKVIYYGGYPGSSGKPVAGRLRWRESVLSFEPDSAPGTLLRFDRSRLLGVQRSEEGLTGARRIRLLVDVETEAAATATLKFEMGGLWWKERKLARWLELLGLVCQGRIADQMPALSEGKRV
jgi:hypothetical protein